MAISGETHDLVLNGEGYMLASSAKGVVNYRKWSVAANRLGMTAQTNEELVGARPEQQLAGFTRLFWSHWQGIGRQFITEGWQADEKTGLVSDLIALKPVLDGSALALAPQAESGTVDATVQGYGAYHSVAISSVQLMSINDRLYTSSDPGTGDTGFVYRTTAAAQIKGLGIFNGTFFVGTTATLYTFNATTGALLPFGVPHGGELIAGYQGLMVVTIGANLYFYLPAVGAWGAAVTLESDITTLTELDGSLYIGTQTALYRLTGQLKPKSPSTAPATLDYFDYSLDIILKVDRFEGGNGFFDKNFNKMCVWRGALWFWANGRVYKGRPVGNHLEVEPQVIYGLPLGMAVCAGCLVVVSRPAIATASTVWVNDGDGWWKLATGGSWSFPFANAGYAAGAINVVQYAPSTSHILVRWLYDSASPVGFKADNYGVARTLQTGKVTLPMVTPADLAGVGKAKAVQLLRIGVEWGTIDAASWWPTINPISTEDCYIQLEVSRDGGNSWTFLVDPIFGDTGYAPGYLDFRGSRFEYPVPYAQAYPQYPASPGYTGSPVADVGWLIRVTWRGQIMPLLKKIWLDYKTVEIEPVSGLGWEFDLVMSVPTLGIDNQADVETALTKLDRLWTLWRSGETIQLNDIDGISSYFVKIVGLEQKRIGAGFMPSTPQSWVASVKVVEVLGG